MTKPSAIEALAREIYDALAANDDINSWHKDGILLTITDALTEHLSAGGDAGAWQPLETVPRDGTTFRAYSPDLIHPDFNPWGSVECVFDGERFIGAVWDGQFDCWNTVPVTPTLWMPIPDSPSYSKEKGRL